jgi:hypothetical protein
MGYLDEAIKKVVQEQALRIQREAAAKKPLRLWRWRWVEPDGFQREELLRDVPIKPAPWHVPPEVDAAAIEADTFSPPHEGTHEQLPPAHQTSE